MIGTNTYASSWSSDNKFIVFSQTSTTSKNDISVSFRSMERACRIPLRRIPFSESGGQISPDAGWMAYISDASGQTEVSYSPSIPAALKVRYPRAAVQSHPLRGRDGKELYFVSGMKLMAVDVKPGSR